MDPIGDKKVIEAPASKYPILEPPIPYIIPLFPHLGAGGKGIKLQEIAWFRLVSVKDRAISPCAP